MKRTGNDVVWSNDGQRAHCKWCGEPAIEVAIDDFQCLNDPDCIVAHEAEQLEAELERQKESLLRVMNNG
jgi:hypothetical protein